MTPVVSSREKAHAALTAMPLQPAVGAGTAGVDLPKLLPAHDREQAACADR